MTLNELYERVRKLNLESEVPSYIDIFVETNDTEPTPVKSFTIKCLEDGVYQIILEG